MKRIDLWFQSELPISIDTSLSWYQALCQMGAKLNELVEAYNAINVDNVYSKDNPPPYPVVSVNSMTGEVQLTIENIPDGVSTSGLESAKSELQALIGQQAGEKADAVKAELEPKIEALETAKSETDEWKKDFENRLNAAAQNIVKHTGDITKLQGTVLVMSGSQWDQESASNVNTWYNNGARVVMVYKGDPLTDENYICDVYTLAKLGVSEVVEALRLDAPQTVILAQNVYDSYSTEQRKALYNNHIRLVVVKDPNGGNLLYAIDADGNSLPIGGSGGGGAVLSVNGKVGNVVITAESINAALDTELESAEHRIESLEDWHTQAAPEIEQAKQDANDAKQTATEAQTQAEQAAINATEAKETASTAYGPENEPPYPVESVNNEKGKISVKVLRDEANNTVLIPIDSVTNKQFVIQTAGYSNGQPELRANIGFFTDTGRFFAALYNNPRTPNANKLAQSMYSDQFPPPYPIQNPKLIDNGTDFDTLLTPGWYYVSSYADFDSFVNAPFNGPIGKHGSTVLVTKVTGSGDTPDIVLQTVINWDGACAQRYYKHDYNDAGPWHTLVNIPVTSVNGLKGDVEVGKLMDKGTTVLSAIDDSRFSYINVVPNTGTNGAAGAGETFYFGFDLSNGQPFARVPKKDGSFQDNQHIYTETFPPPYPVTKVNGQTGNVNLTAADVGAPTTTAFEETARQALVAYSPSNPPPAQIARSVFNAQKWNGEDESVTITTTIKAENIVGGLFRKIGTTMWLNSAKLPVQYSQGSNNLTIFFSPPDDWNPWPNATMDIVLFYLP